MYLRENLISRKLLAAAMLSGLVLAAGCGSDGTLDGADLAPSATHTYKLADTKYTRNIEVFDNVKRLDDRAAAVAFLEPNKVRFPASVAPLLAEYQPGDIMATSEGSGLLRRVEKIEQQGDQIVVLTSSASISDVFASGEIYFAAHAEPNLEVPENFRTFAGTDERGMRVVEQGLGDISYDGGWDGSLFNWNKDFASDLNALIPDDHLIVEEASMNFDVGAEFYAEINARAWKPKVSLNSLRAGANGQANATLRVKLESADAFNFSKDYVLLSTKPGENALLSKPIKSIPILGLVQLQFGARATLHLEAKVEGTISATGQVAVNGTLSGGIERKDGSWKGYHNGALSPSGYAPAFDGEKAFHAQAKLNTEITVEISDSITGSLVVEPAIVTMDLSQEINANSGACPYYFNINTTGKASGIIKSIGVDLPIVGFLGFDIMDAPSKWTFYDKDFLTTTGQLPLPGICDENYQVPTFGNGGRHEGMMCEEATDCNEGLACFRNTCVTEGPIRFSVAWFADTDIDLEVVTPSGEVVNWRNFSNASADGLLYDFPNCTNKCTGPAPYVENIYSDISPRPGTYLIRVVHFKNRLGSDAKGDFEVLIDHNGKETHEGGNIRNATSSSVPGHNGKAVEFEYTVK